jgi:hypothetical protein
MWADAANHHAYTPHSTGMACDAVSHDEEQLQMALWAISSAPLFMSTHVRGPVQSSPVQSSPALLTSC